MEAPRGAREPTGTNGPTLNTHTSTTSWLTDIQGMLVKPLYGSQPTQTPSRTRARGTHWGHSREYMVDYLVVVIAAGKRPAPIPNLEAKPASADGTAPGRVWESRTPPQHTSRWGLGTICSKTPPLCYTHNTHQLHSFVFSSSAVSPPQR